LLGPDSERPGTRNEPAVKAAADFKKSRLLLLLILNASFTLFINNRFIIGWVEIYSAVLLIKASRLLSGDHDGVFMLPWPP
jgi:hypothetical protein